MPQYIDYNKIKDSNEGTIKIKCYNNGNKWLCPDPKNEDLCDAIENWYNSCHWIQYKEIYITDETYANFISNGEK